MKKLAIYPENITVLSGKDTYEVDLPDGDAAVRYCVRSDHPVQLYLLAGEKCIPLASGVCCQGQERVRDCRAIMIQAPKKAIVAVEVYHKKVRIADVLDDKPVAVTVPEPTTVNLAAMVSRLVGEALKAQHGGNVEIDVEEELDEALEEIEDIDPEFGIGYAEMDEEELGRIVGAKRDKNRSAATEPEPADRGRKSGAGKKRQEKEGERLVRGEDGKTYRLVETDPGVPDDAGRNEEGNAATTADE